MSLLDDVKIVCRVSSSVFDTELQAHIDAALADMKRVGIKDELLNVDDLHPLVRAAVFTYARANFGYDVSERSQFEDSYRSLVISLLNSDANKASVENGEV